MTARHIIPTILVPVFVCVIFFAVLVVQGTTPAIGSAPNAFTASQQEPLPLAKQTSQAKAEKARREKEEKARRYEFESGKEMARGIGYEPETGKVARLADPGTEEMQQVGATPVLVALERAPVLTVLRYHELQHLKRSFDGPSYPWNDGFKSSDITTALAATKAAIDKDVATGKLFPLPYGTPGRVVEFRPPGYVPPPLNETPSSPSARVFEKLVRDDFRINGTYLVEVLEGAAKGKQVWTDAARSNRPLSGDIVYLYLPKYPTSPIPLGTMQTGLLTVVRQDAIDALPLEGRVTDPKAQAHFDNLVRAKHLVLLPPGTVCKILDYSSTEGLCLLSPQDGTQKNNALVARLTYVTLRLPAGNVLTSTEGKTDLPPTK